MTALDLTCENRLEVSPFVSERSFGRMNEMLAGLKQGGFAGERAEMDLREALSTTTAPFAFAHSLNAKNLDDWDKAERQWTKIADVETVDDFDPVTFETLRFNIGEDLKYGKGTQGNAGVSPVVPEGDTYQYTYGYSEEAVKASLEKRGFKVGAITLERILSKRLRPLVRQLPGDMLEVALDTDEFLVFNALQSEATAASALKAGKAPISGAATTAHAAFSIDALRVALSQVPTRKVAGRKVTLAKSYYIAVPLGYGEIVQAELDKARLLTGIREENGTQTQVFGAPSLGNLAKIAGVIESEWIDEVKPGSMPWYVTPAAGSTKRPGLKKLQLTGRTAPEVLVDNRTGITLFGPSGDAFDRAHFDNDTTDLKLRQFTNAALITQDQLIWSNGSGAA